MIIDVHCHLWDKSLITPMAPEETKKQAEFLSAELLIEHMNQAKIDKTVLLALDSTITQNWAKDYKEYNNYIIQKVNQHPDRLIGFF